MKQSGLLLPKVTSSTVASQHIPAVVTLTLAAAVAGVWKIVVLFNMGQLAIKTHTTHRVHRVNVSINWPTCNAV